MLTGVSTDFWGPVSNFGIPIAAVMDTQKDPDMCALPSLIPQAHKLAAIPSLTCDYDKLTFVSAKTASRAV